MSDESDLDEHRMKRAKQREERTVARFRSSTQGLRRVFEKHFPERDGPVEELVYHLAKVEAQLPNLNKAIRLARYPGAGDRGARRFAMGLWENLSFIQKHLKDAMDALERLAHDPELVGEADGDSSSTAGFLQD